MALIRSVIATDAPLRRSACAVANPIPREPPVTNATFPVSEAHESSQVATRQLRKLEAAIGYGVVEVGSCLVNSEYSTDSCRLSASSELENWAARPRMRSRARERVRRVILIDDAAAGRRRARRWTSSRQEHRGSIPTSKEAPISPASSAPRSASSPIAAAGRRANGRATKVLRC